MWTGIFYIRSWHSMTQRLDLKSFGSNFKHLKAKNFDIWHIQHIYDIAHDNLILSKSLRLGEQINWTSTHSTSHGDFLGALQSRLKMGSNDVKCNLYCPHYSPFRCKSTFSPSFHSPPNGPSLPLLTKRFVDTIRFSPLCLHLKTKVSPPPCGWATWKHGKGMKVKCLQHI